MINTSEFKNFKREEIVETIWFLEEAIEALPMTGRNTYPGPRGVCRELTNYLETVLDEAQKCLKKA